MQRESRFFLKECFHMHIAVLNLKNALVILQSLNCYGSSNDQLDCVNTKGFCLLSFFVSPITRRRPPMYSFTFLTS